MKPNPANLVGSLRSFALNGGFSGIGNSSRLPRPPAPPRFPPNAGSNGLAPVNPPPIEEALAFGISPTALKSISSSSAHDEPPNDSSFKKVDKSILTPFFGPIF
ncbi:hypothetical protein WICMUC_001770 [Wickerhamomyces mucosus]|uniref:Uncharacterized protein n=1 Tax=Wickerhamomyces mucosus TaxID=1378264 RepID=A0A9P8PTU6_9ASCO|nr:hypothetical protein WICMUC_001770 [Wickerhamomyces mucosus]